MLIGTGLHGLTFAHPKLHVIVHNGLPNDFSVIVGDDPPYLVELVGFDKELK